MSKLSSMDVIYGALLLACMVVGHSAYVNNFDQPVHFQCPYGQYLSDITSYHANRQEDRRWAYSCRGSGATVGCMWGGYANNWDQPLTYLCPGERVITGVSSYHDNKKEDRRFRFRCCAISGKKASNCQFTGYVNNWDGYMSWNLPANKVLKGAFSHHANSKEDRRWKYIICDI